MKTLTVAFIHYELPGTAVVWVAPESTIKPDALPLANAVKTGDLTIKNAHLGFQLWIMQMPHIKCSDIFTNFNNKEIPTQEC